MRGLSNAKLPVILAIVVCDVIIKGESSTLTKTVTLFETRDENLDITINVMDASYSSLSRHNSRSYENKSMSREYEPEGKSSKMAEFRPIVICILVFELCERLCFYSINANFVRFCTIYLDVDNVTALNLSLIFTAVLYFLCILGGWLSDAILGRYRMILFSGLVYFVGVALITVVTFDFSQYFGNVYLNTVDRRVFSGFGLIMISVGTGGIKTVVGPFGAQQLDQNNPNLTRLYFIWFYWFVNMGATVAFTVVAYIQQNYSFFYGFLIPLTSILVAMIIFILPSKFYKNDEKIDNPISDYCGIVVEAVNRKYKSIYNYESFLDYARLSNGGSYKDKRINGLIRLKKIIPVLLTFIPFYIAYVQMQSSYLVQSEHLNLQFPGNFTFPVASLNVVNSVVILAIIPLFAVIVYPAIRFCCGHQPTSLQRIGFGLFLSALSVLTAALLEIARKRDLDTNGGISQVVFENTYNVSRISVLAQVPQFLLVGLGEVFAATTGLEFAFSQAPHSQRSLVSGIFYFMIGAGSLLGSVLIQLVNLNPGNQWMADDIDQGHYEYFFLLLFGIIVLDVLIFIFVARRYRYADYSDDDADLDETERLVVKYTTRSSLGDVVIERGSQGD